MVSLLRISGGTALALGAAFGLLACEKVKELVGSVERAAEAGPAQATGTPADPALAALVQRDSGGLVMRKDLPLPASFRVDWERWDEMTNIRMANFGAVPGKPGELDSETLAARKFFAKATIQRVTPERYTLTIPPLPVIAPAKDAAENAPPPPAISTGEALAGSTVTLVRRDGAWQVERPRGAVDFKALNWGDNLCGAFDSLLRHSNMTTAPRWLAATPLLPGKEIPFAGEDLAILLGMPASGELRLRYEGEETVAGHPCAAFSVTGSYQTVPTLQWHGQWESEQMTVDSGRVFLSALYPLVVRLDFSGIVSLSVWSGGSGQGRPTATIQGTTHRTLTAVPVFPEGWSPSPESRPGS